MVLNYNQTADSNDSIILMTTSLIDYDAVYNITYSFNNDSRIDCSKTEMDILNINFSQYQFPRPENLKANLSLKDYVEIIVCIIAMCVILIGNGGVIAAVALNRTLRTTINYYLTNLAVSDILICAFCLWILQVNDVTKPLYILGPFMCKVNAFAQMTCLTSSVLTLSAISCDRFVAIHYPLRVRVTKQRTGLVITVIWIISLLVSIPFLLYRKHHVIQWQDFTETKCMETWPAPTHYDSRRGQCITLNTTKQMYYTAVTVMLFFIPVLVMASAYSMIIWTLWVREVPGESMAWKDSPLSQVAATKRVIKMVCVVLAIFVLSWMPLQVIVLYSQFGHSSHDYGELPKWFSSLSYFSHLVAYASSATNPIIYGGYNKNFRDSLYALLRCKCYQPNRPCSIRTLDTGLSLATRVKCVNNQKKPKIAFTDQII